MGLRRQGRAELIPCVDGGSPLAGRRPGRVAEDLMVFHDDGERRKREVLGNKEFEAAGREVIQCDSTRP